jgi:hypothetical protein
MPYDNNQRRRKCCAGLLARAEHTPAGNKFTAQVFGGHQSKARLCSDTTVVLCCAPRQLQDSSTYLQGQMQIPTPYESACLEVSTYLSHQLEAH